MWCRYAAARQRIVRVDHRRLLFPPQPRVTGNPQDVTIAPPRVDGCLARAKASQLGAIAAVHTHIDHVDDPT